MVCTCQNGSKNYELNSISEKTLSNYEVISARKGPSNNAALMNGDNFFTMLSRNSKLKSISKKTLSNYEVISANEW